MRHLQIKKSVIIFIGIGYLNENDFKALCWVNIFFWSVCMLKPYMYGWFPAYITRFIDIVIYRVVC